MQILHHLLSSYSKQHVSGARGCTDNLNINSKNTVRIHPASHNSSLFQRKQCLSAAYQVWLTSGRWDSGSGLATPPGDPTRSSAGAYRCSSWFAASHRAGCRPRWAQWHLTPLGWYPRLEQVTWNNNRQEVTAHATVCFQGSDAYLWSQGCASLTVFHFGAKLALLDILKQRLMALHFITCLTARLVKQSAIPTGRGAIDNRKKWQVLLNEQKA